MKRLFGINSSLLFLIGISIIFFAFIFLQSCKSPTEPISKGLSLKAADITCTEVWLNLNANNIPLPVNVTINKNDSLLFSITLTTVDTIIYDNNLSPNKAYTYQAQSGNLKSETVTVNTLDTTSHSITWQKFVIGEFQSTLYDVWGTDENNVYATGIVRLNGNAYGMLHYDGNEWQPVSSTGGYAIYGFGKNDIWTAGGGVFHFDGTTWKQIDSKIVNSQAIPLDSILFYNTPYKAIWGTSSSNLYLVGGKGRVIYWNGSKASIIYDYNDPNDFSFSDINGTSTNNIWATGQKKSAFANLVFHYDGSLWRQDNSVPFYQEVSTTVFTPTYGQSIFGGVEVSIKKFDRWYNMIYPIGYVIGKIRGKSINDFFAVGDWGTVVHFNGLTWHYYSELYTPSGGANHGVFEIGNKIFVVGDNEDDISAKIIIGTKQ